MSAYSNTSAQARNAKRSELLGSREKDARDNTRSTFDAYDDTEGPTLAQARIDRLREQQRQQLQDAVRISHQTVNTGHATTGELMRQGETIDRTNKSVDKIEYELKVSDKIVKSMSGLTGLVASWFTRDPKMAKSKGDKSGIGEVPKSEYTHQEPTVTAARNISQQSTISKEPAQKGARSDVDTDRLLEELQGNLAVMRDQSVNQRAVLIEQHKKLDTLIEKMDKTNQHMKTTERNIKKVT